MILDKVNMPNDLKSLNMAELNKLSSEIRDCIIKKVNITGGHFGPKLLLLCIMFLIARRIKLFSMFHISVILIKS